MHPRWPHLYRVNWPDGVVSTPANLTWCRDAIRRWNDRPKLKLVVSNPPRDTSNAAAA
jgi:hypothetical protein